MQSTENLKLNLYEPTDYVLHDHFNSDNRKLDAAVTAARSFHKLREFTAAASARRQTFDLSGIQWDQWQYLHLDFLAQADYESTCYMDLYFNGDATTRNVYWHQGYSSGDACTLARVRANGSGDAKAVWADRITLEVGCQGDRALRLLSNGGIGRHETFLFRDLQTVTVSMQSVDILAGAKLVVWGEG